MAIPEADRKELLRLARESVEATVSRLAGPRPAHSQGALGQLRGCFVTLTNHGQLRGCIGTFQPRLKLAEQVIQMANHAARDPRFTRNPLTPRELPALTMQVSVLSELEEIANPLDIQLGVHGIYITCGFASGCFLPEVATETGWSKEEFLSHCCAGKAGMSPDAWRQPGTKVYIFTSEKFSEGEM